MKSRFARCAIIIASERQTHSERRRRRLHLLFLRLLRLRLTIRERNYLTSSSLAQTCAWDVMYTTRCSKSFINTVSLPPTAFDRLLVVFSRHYQVKSGPGRRGRPPKFKSACTVLACILHFYTAAVDQKTLCKLFGAPPATLSRVLAAAERALCTALRELPEAAVRWPSFQQQAEWAMQVERKEPLVRGCFCVADGKNYNVQEPSRSEVQNAFYNGWLHSVKVTGVLCYGLDGTLIWGKHNHPGSWNDGEMSRQLQVRLADRSMTMEGGKCATDAAFPVSQSSRLIIVTPLKDGDLERASPECRAGLIAMNAAITSVRQAAEWGMGCISKCYRRLQLPLPHNAPLRALRLWNVYHLYNFRVRTTEISQIRNSFNWISIESMTLTSKTNRVGLVAVLLRVGVVRLRGFGNAGRLHRLAHVLRCRRFAGCRCCRWCLVRSAN